MGGLGSASWSNLVGRWAGFCQGGIQQPSHEDRSGFPNVMGELALSKRWIRGKVKCNWQRGCVDGLSAAWEDLNNQCIQTGVSSAKWLEKWIQTDDWEEVNLCSLRWFYQAIHLSSGHSMHWTHHDEHTDHFHVLCQPMVWIKVVVFSSRRVSSLLLPLSTVPGLWPVSFTGHRRSTTACHAILDLVHSSCLRTDIIIRFSLPRRIPDLIFLSSFPTDEMIWLWVFYSFFSSTMALEFYFHHVVGLLQLIWVIFGESKWCFLFFRPYGFQVPDAGQYRP